MGVIEKLDFTDVVREICNLDWSTLSEDEMVEAAWAYYYFSVQFGESLHVALAMHPEDEMLRQLASEECDTSNLSPWPGVAAPGERVDHHVFMRRSLALQKIDPARQRVLEAAGANYLATTRGLSDAVRCMSIASYEDGGLERVFHAMLQAPSWNTDLLRAFKHFLEEHIRFDSDPDAGHGALARHIPIDQRVVPIWTAFRELFMACVPKLAA